MNKILVYVRDEKIARNAILFAKKRCEKCKDSSVKFIVNNGYVRQQASSLGIDAKMKQECSEMTDKMIVSIKKEFFPNEVLVLSVISGEDPARFMVDIIEKDKDIYMIALGYSTISNASDDINQALDMISRISKLSNNMLPFMLMPDGITEYHVGQLS